MVVVVAVCGSGGGGGGGGCLWWWLYACVVDQMWFPSSSAGTAMIDLLDNEDEDGDNLDGGDGSNDAESRGSFDNDRLVIANDATARTARNIPPAKTLWCAVLWCAVLCVSSFFYFLFCVALLCCVYLFPLAFVCA